MANTATIAWIRIDSLALANPNLFDYYRRLQPITGLKGKVDGTSFNYFRRGQPNITLIIAT